MPRTLSRLANAAPRNFPADDNHNGQFKRRDIHCLAPPCLLYFLAATAARLKLTSMAAFLLKLVLRNCLRHPLRTGLTVLGIIVAITAFGLLRTTIDA